MANPFDRSKWESWHTRTDEAKERDRKALINVLEFNTGVAYGIIFPFSPIFSYYSGQDGDKVLAQTISSSLVTWLTIQALGGAEFGAMQVARGMVTKAVLPVAIPTVGPVIGTKVFVEFHKKYEPTEPTHQPSWWNSLAAAMGGTFGGMEY